MISRTIIFTGLMLVSCVKPTITVNIGNHTYSIPSQYVISVEKVDVSGEYEKRTNILALDFSFDEKLIEYDRPNSWLPKSPITAILYSRENTALTGFSPSLSTFVEFPIAGRKIVEFEEIYRVFKEDSRISWNAYPKSQTSINASKIKAKWMAECIPLGGVKGSDQSRESMDIPTSCRINIEYQNAILTLTTSERNLADNAEEIVKLVLQRMDSWKVSHKVFKSG